MYPGVTHLDFTGPQQVLARTPGISVTVASVGGRPVRADGLTFADLAPLEAIERCDVVCVPGGGGVTDAMLDDLFMHHVRRLALEARYITSVCTGSLILGAAGLLEGKRATCHWAWRDMLPLFGAIADDGRVVRDGNVITGGGVTAGIDFALTLVAELTDDFTAQSVQLGLEYAPQPPFDAGRPETAPAEVLERVLARNAQTLPLRRPVTEKVAAEYRRVGPR
jgi:cyclohexyl-isocyanide hydratase